MKQMFTLGVRAILKDYIHMMKRQLYEFYGLMVCDYKWIISSFELLRPLLIKILGN